MRVKIITDGAADIDEEEALKLGVTRLAAPVYFKGEKEGVYSAEEFWRKMKAGKAATTSQIPPESFLEEFKRAEKEKTGAVCIVISSAMSATYKNAALVKADGKFDGVRVIDSRMASVAERALVLKACSLRDKGLSADEIADELENFKRRVKLLACMDTLKYAAAGGRVSASAAAIGTLMNIKPIISFSTEGKIIIAARPAGKRRGATRLAELLEEAGYDKAYPPVPIYSDSAEACDSFMEKAESRGIICGPKTPIGITVGAHIGPAAFGVVFVKQRN